MGLNIDSIQYIPFIDFSDQTLKQKNTIQNNNIQNNEQITQLS